MNINGGQDWDTVVIRKKAPKAGTVNKDKVVNDALRAGAQIEAVKKFGAGANKVTGAGKDAAKLDRETEELHHDRVPTELKKRIQTARLEKKLTQAQLGQLINEKPNVIQEYENGKAIPAPAVLSKLSRVLGVQLSVKKK
ncbi:MBF1-domain-containing protein [Coccomyxa subellipsoidea C-169]|uniref:MBF1-domain-containing protein n=1 Tax=Coccomyxa subellipsoidea (strain C-169) TaxID=574566 RepID=I0YW33_COCSC|nr:MBF1-domain-containing protein [Coccomyxa subellipsoidea C-169]EIE22602.1 MBF1-domain-containing protein [Coccomyxa subellipsoidea C-169]|eukprot:XP_005647146.1 MBF1-domain-containing protein [Coccomyxa subellipsoidea C-169]